jgi:DNA polymerase
MIKPKVIVALGRIAAQNLLETTSALKQMRERLWQYAGVNMIVTYHPAAILRNPGLLEVAKNDFKFILKTYHDVKKHQI